MVRVKKEEEGVICAWYLHSAKTSLSYSYFLESVSRATKGNWIPKTFIMDFELALRYFRLFLSILIIKYYLLINFIDIKFVRIIICIFIK